MLLFRLSGIFALPKKSNNRTKISLFYLVQFSKGFCKLSDPTLFLEHS